MSDNNFIPEQEEYKPLSPFKLFVKSNFPFIESTFEALDNYGLYCKIVEYLNTVIENLNISEDNIGNLYDSFVELHNYVQNYFENLDVQDEINNKLDEMAETGELDIIVDRYLSYIENEFDLRMDNQDNKILAIQNIINSLTNYAPIPVSSTSDMTDTTKIYLNTTNGQWYYYNGSVWTSGGTYQAQEESSELQKINANKINRDVYKSIYKPYTSVNGYIKSTDGTIKNDDATSLNYNTSDFIHLNSGDVLKIESPLRFFALYDSGKTFDSLLINANTYGYTYTATAECYIRFSFFRFLTKNIVCYLDNNKDSIDYVPTIIEQNTKLNQFNLAQIEKIFQNTLGYTTQQIPVTLISGYSYDWFNDQLDEQANNSYGVIDVEMGDILVMSGYSYHRYMMATLKSGSNRFSIPTVGYYQSLAKDENIEFIVPFSGKLYINKIGTTDARTPIILKKQSVINNLSQLIDLLDSNILYQKKIAYLGDSFTHGNFSNSTTNDYIIESGKYQGQYKVYPFLIGNRNSMEVDNLAVNGMTLAQYESASNVLSKNGGAYTQIDNDTNYIIIKIGINDDHRNIPIGNINDSENTTFYGAYNKVMNYLIENYPNAKIGIIASNGIYDSNYIEATVKIAKKFGVKCLNESMDYNIPLLIRCLKPDVDSSIQEMINQKWYVNNSSENANYHPNELAHEFESYIVEDFIRSL